MSCAGFRCTFPAYEIEKVSVPLI